MELSAVLELFDCKPVTIGLMVEGASRLGYMGLAEWLRDARNFKAAAARMEVPVRIIPIFRDEARKPC